MKYALCTVFALLSIVSCGSNDTIIEDPRPIDKDVYNFAFKSYHVQGTTLYQGSLGQKSNPEESYLNTYWSLYQEPAWKKIILDLKNSSIQLISDNSTVQTHSITIANDSVLLNDTPKQPNYIGSFNKKESSFTLKRTYRYVKKVPRNETDALFITKSAFFGTTQYENMFGSVFSAPSQMTQNGDEVLWSNIEYSYQSL
ncbi:MAG: hypothetical protein MUW56_04660 [Chryseobacterium sp.]|uniref:hypothetical protein n=1 Tax=Chryseobacterium sp. TaxID=1871047 RepID=UPI0025C4BB36|nr:hypothetical protein [Chryseobacterium sp.]MCJ7932927.1 hypothetical protein [Chryseobacterium sp.]